MINPEFDPNLIFRTRATLNVARGHYDAWFQEAVEVVVARKVTRGVGSPERQRRTRPRTGPTAGDMDDDMDMFRRRPATNDTTGDDEPDAE